jgi:hypothetical protein
MVAHMTRKDIVMVVSRGIALYFFAWSVDNATYLPDRFHVLSHHLKQQSVFATDHYWRNWDITSIIFTFIRVFALFALAVWLYRCGPLVQKFFFPNPDSQD